MAQNRLAKMLGQLAETVHGDSRSKREVEYLNQSVSRYDLERRQREIDAGKFKSF